MTNFTERLEGTSLADDARACLVCTIIDWCNEAENVTPTERGWCRILGCFPKEKPRHGKEQKGLYPRSQIRKLFDALEEEGVLRVVHGKGRGKNTYEVPVGMNLLADKRADYERRKAEWKKQVIEKLRPEVEKNNATWAGVRNFFEYWCEHDIDYNMKWENALKDSGKKYFSIGGRWARWKDKIVIEETVDDVKMKREQKPKGVQTGPTADENYGKKDPKMEDLFNEWLKMKGIGAEEYDYGSMHEEWEEYKNAHS